MRQGWAQVAGAALAVGLLGVGATAAPAGADGTAWVWPLRPRPAVMHAYAPPAGPYAPGHRGVDLAGSAGQQALVVADGVVTFAGQVAGKGVVVVDHGSESSTYQPVSASVRSGDTVAAGEVIGRLQLGGSHCWPDACLHLGRIVGDIYLDPLELLGAGPVRLLPLAGPLPAQPRAPPAVQLGGLRPAVAGISVGLACAQARGCARP